MRYSTTNKDTVFSTPPTHRHVVEQKFLVAAGQGECGRLTRRTRFSSTGNGQQAPTWPLPPSLFGRLAMNDSLSRFSTVRDRSAELLKGEPAPCTWTSRSMTCGGQAVSTGPMHEPQNIPSRTVRLSVLRASILSALNNEHVCLFLNSWRHAAAVLPDDHFYARRTVTSSILHGPSGSLLVQSQVG